MVKIRLTKTGRKNAPSYRIVVADARSPRDGKFIEVIGFYNPSHNPAQSKIDKKKYEEWVKKGAQPTEAVKQIVEGKYEFVPYDPKAIAEAKEKAKAEAEEKAAGNSESPAEEAKAEDSEAKEDETKAEETTKDEGTQTSEKPEAEEKPSEKPAEQTEKKE